MIRLVPNSCTSPVSTLKGWPASATSSPMRSTRGSRRISSAIASRTASPYVSPRSLMTAPPWLQPAQRFGLEPSEILQVLTTDPDDQVRVDPRVLVDDDVPDAGRRPRPVWPSGARDPREAALHGASWRFDGAARAVTRRRPGPP